MPQFDAGRGFQPGLNVRDFDYLLHLLEGKDSYPNGVLWPLVAARRRARPGRSRRSRTTWASAGIVRRPPRRECRIPDETEV